MGRPASLCLGRRGPLAHAGRHTGLVGSPEIANADESVDHRSFRAEPRALTAGGLKDPPAGIEFYSSKRNVDSA